ncbi:hypothetical protein SSBR45G_33170 [Bradyrhizobium sp. SSBR45G]|nr:hypothetical protein SSBR45G_33170 [Bradyrhizobium sp. SSBR45G]GLH86191.1 hypothetical protein SSBR45R_36510 [Bradyrhizobium sp. SSBR45R]
MAGAVIAAPTVEGAATGTGVSVATGAGGAFGFRATTAACRTPCFRIDRCLAGGFRCIITVCAGFGLHDASSICSIVGLLDAA